MGSTTSSTNPPRGAGLSSVLLSDALGRDRSINTFAGLARDIEPVYARLDTAGQKTTVLAPLNLAIESMAQKPWEDGRDYDTLGANAYEGDAGRDRAEQNIRRLVEAHLIPQSPWEKGVKATAIGDAREIWWEEKSDGTRVIQPDGIEVSGHVGSVLNGELWILKRVRERA